ncbi:nucleotidyltransferase-like protein [Evansella sp. LMS18]|uniref:nucleotidyltransferase-like protein n=1 Tax=Evansella sp. LMS18 TaxID=2924033 RepID=UPI0020D0CC31|nr:nucleotidyltransferase-like protein [Evansella sp. LMS18]UTR09093.1 nucleotidyltransferase-like protein [Evansella sp. LMS18]
MDDLLRQLYQDRTSAEYTLGIIAVNSRNKLDSTTDYFDVVLLIIVEDSTPPWEVKHYTYNEQKIAMHIVSTNQLYNWLLTSSNRKVVDWLMNGRVIFDRNEYTINFRKQLLEFPAEERRIRTGVEFAKLIRRFTDGKALFHQGHMLDAYNQIVHALHHLARLSVIEHGFYPEVTVWEQVRNIEPEIYKLYAELVKGNESIEKKLELLLIANEFGLMTKTKLGSAHLFDLLKTKETPWSIEEIKQQLSINDYSLDLTIMLEYLVEKGYVDVIKEETKGKEIFHRKYILNQHGYNKEEK